MASTKRVDTQTMTTSNTSRPASITVVDSVGCHFCADADTAIEQLANEFALTVEHVPMASAAGLNLMADHGAGMSPLVLLDGSFVSAGRLPRGRLRSMLAAAGYTPLEQAS